MTFAAQMVRVINLLNRPLPLKFFHLVGGLYYWLPLQFYQ